MTSNIKFDFSLADTGYSPPTSGQASFDFSKVLWLAPSVEKTLALQTDISFRYTINGSVTPPLRLPVDITAVFPLIYVDGSLNSYQIQVVEDSFLNTVDPTAYLGMPTYCPGMDYTALSSLRNRNFWPLDPPKLTPVADVFLDEFDFVPAQPNIVNNFPSVSLPWTNDGYLVPTMNEVFYDRIIVEPARSDIGNISAERTVYINVFNSFLVPRTLTSIGVANADGIVLSPSSTPVTFGILEQKEYAVTITPDGPPSIKAVYTFTFDIGRGTATVIGTRTVAYPLLQRKGLVEKLAWLTDVMTSNDGSEQRMQLRRYPNQVYSGTSYVPPRQRQLMRSLLYGWRSNTWAVPISGEAGRLTASTLPSSPIISADTSYAQYKIGGLCLLYASPTKYSLFEIEAFDGTSITATENINRIFAIDSLVMPMVSADLQSSPTRMLTGFTDTLEAEFRAAELFPITTVPSPVQYLGEDTYFGEQLTEVGDTQLPEVYTAREDLVDYGVGKYQSFSPWLDTKIKRTISFGFRNRQEIWGYRQWLYRRSGKLRPFWMPTFEDDFAVVDDGPIFDTILARNDGQFTYASDRKHIAVLKVDGTWLPREIIAFAADGFNVALTVESLQGLPVQSIRCISYLDLKRLATDSVTIEWQGNDTATSTVTVVDTE